MPSPETATLPVPPPALDLHQALWYATGRIRFTIMWAEFVAAWLLSVAIFFGIGFIDPASTPLGFVDLYLGTIVFAPTGVYAILQARRAQLSLGDWETQMIPFMYSVKFEMFPFVGDDRERDIWERFVSIFPELERMWKPNGILPWTRRKTYVKFRATVRGKENEHFFHIFGRYRDDEVFVVRRYEEDKPVTNDDLATLKVEIEDVLRKLGIHEFMVATFAAGGYEPDAIKYAASEESLVDGEQPIDLFTETVKGYEVAFASTDYDSGSL
jgi:hypothetical protein